MQTLPKAPTLTLNELADELVRQQRSKIDAVVDTRRITFNTGTEGSTLAFDDAAAEDGVTGGIVNEHAHGQLAERLKIPKRYYDRMREEAPTLLDGNVSHWFYNHPETRLIRLLDGNVRAVLSDRYRRLDNYDLMEHLLPIFNEIDDLEFHVAALTDSRLYIRAILPSLEEEVKLGDIVQAGVQVRNSEVGAGKLAVEPFIWRLACLNGMVSAEHSLTKMHVGRKAEESEEAIYAFYSDETLEADDKAFFLKVGDLVRGALSEVQFKGIVDSMREASESDEIANPVAATERLAAKFDLTEAEQSSVLMNLAQGGDLTKWGLANAVTSAAKDSAGFDRQNELEALGSTVVALPEKEYAVIAAPN